MYLIDMVKRAFFYSQGRLRALPWGFHLISLYQMANDLKRNQLSAQAKKRLKWMDYCQKNKESLFNLQTLWHFKTAVSSHLTK
jgi:hypothetical protein